MIVIIIFYYEFVLSNNLCKKDNWVKDKDEFFLELSKKFTEFSSFKNEFQNFILSIISRKSENNVISLTNQEIEIIKDLNK